MSKGIPFPIKNPLSRKKRHEVDRIMEISNPHETKYHGNNYNEHDLIDLKTLRAPKIITQTVSKDDVLVSAAKPPIAPTSIKPTSTRPTQLKTQLKTQSKTRSIAKQQNQPQNQSNRRISSGSEYSIVARLSEIVPYTIARDRYLRESVLNPTLNPVDPELAWSEVESNRSFQSACESYKKCLLKLIIVAIDVVVHTGEVTRISVNKFMKRLYCGDDGREYKGEDIHYGFPLKTEDITMSTCGAYTKRDQTIWTKRDQAIWTKRDQATWKKRRTTNPFEELQNALIRYGYYLQDLTENPEYGHVITIGPQPIICDHVLWHGLNVIYSVPN